MSRGTLYNQPKQKVSLPDELTQAVVKNAGRYPIPEGRKYEYGTAGVYQHLHLPDLR